MSTRRSLDALLRWKEALLPSFCLMFSSPRVFQRIQLVPVNLYQTSDTPFSEIATITLHPLRRVQIMSLLRMSHKWPPHQAHSSISELRTGFQRSLLSPLHFRSHLGDVFDIHGWIWMVRQVGSVCQTTLSFILFTFPRHFLKSPFLCVSISPPWAELAL